MSSKQDYLRIFKNRYSDKPESLVIFDQYFKDSTVITIDVDDITAGGIMRSTLIDKGVDRVGFFVVDQQYEGRWLGSKIVRMVSLEDNIIGFPNIFSRLIFKKTGWIVNPVCICKINKESTPPVAISSDFDPTPWIKSRYIDHLLAPMYTIFSFNGSTIVLKKYNTTCHLMDYDLEKFSELLPAIKHVAFNQLNCEQLTFWHNKFIPNSIEKEETSTSSSFSNEETFKKLGDKLYMGLSDVY